jgi:hypothetical protein
MLRAAIGTVKARVFVACAALSLAAACLSACYWQRYPRLVETHLELLLEFAAKLQALAEDGRRVPPERWGEFTYPLERARDFARIAAQRFAGRRSLASFGEATSAYAALVADPGILAQPDAAARVARHVESLRAAAARTRTDLANEAHETS